MSEVELTQKLDQAIDALLLNAAAPGAGYEGELGQLLDVALGLRALPRPDFKARLKAELEREIAMATAKESIKAAKSQTSKMPKGFRTVTPYIVVADVHQQIDFITQVFGAEGKVYGLGSQGGFHSEYRIGDSMVMIGGGGKGSKWKGESVPAALHVYVEDVDAAYGRALEAGGTSLMPPTDMDYGERGAGVEDSGGNHWYLATAHGATYVPEGGQNLMPYFHPVGSVRMIQFLKDALGAEEIAVHKSPDGIVHHAQVRIGDSIVEMGEAHGQWQPRPMHFMLYVDDADAWYARAMKVEGAISVQEPADQSYGSRTGAIQDPFGNVWYLATPLG